MGRRGFGKYILEEALDGGAVAYRAVDQLLGRHVILRLMPSELAENEHLEDQFIRHIQAAERLNHPSIARIVDVSQHDGRYYVATEVPERILLDQALKTPKTLSPVKACLIPRRIAEALDYAHSMGAGPRGPGLVHPRTVSSDCLLSSMIYCGRCGSPMIGSSAKSGRFLYYACQSYCKQGKHACDARMVRKDRIETFIIGRVEEDILTRDNLAGLIAMTNQEADRARGECGAQIAVLDSQIASTRRRLDKLYDVLETGELDVHDLAPRLKDLKAQTTDLETQRPRLQE